MENTMGVLGRGCLEAFLAGGSVFNGIAMYALYRGEHQIIGRIVKPILCFSLITAIGVQALRVYLPNMEHYSDSLRPIHYQIYPCIGILSFVITPSILNKGSVSPLLATVITLITAIVDWHLMKGINKTHKTETHNDQ